MVGHFSGVYTGYEKRIGKGGEYAIVRFLDEKGKIFECISKDFETLECLERLEQVDFVAEIELRNTYTKITFMGLE